MLKFARLGPFGRTSMSIYSVVLDKEYTVRTFIEAVLEERNMEQGSIGIADGLSFFGKPFCEYVLGRLLTEMDNDVLDKPVIRVTARGDTWNRKDYFLEV